ncbi:MAG: hypothetical protein LH473_00815 [Chitinophagales bacterium]|nr:hypothetical protein [Chitinophagales bacterium]
MTYPAITKEQIPYQLLIHNEVLTEAEEKQLRKNKLLKAVQQNKLFYSKAKIVFDTAEGTKEVLANIWEVTDNNVMLKGGINIPVCCIRDVFLENNN